MPKKKESHQKAKRPVTPRNCPFCATKTNPDFLDTKTLGKYVTERGKILSAARSGLCTLHQRRVTTAVKHARHLALMPFVQRI